MMNMLDISNKYLDKFMKNELEKYSMELFNKHYELLELSEMDKLSKYIHDVYHPKWKPIIHYGIKTFYEVSNVGNIRNTKTGLVLKPKQDRYGYLKFNMCVNKKAINTLIHRLVAQAFIPNPDNKTQVNHINGNKQCNWVGNLEWVTPKENIQHAIKTGLATRNGEGNPNNKSTIEEIHNVCRLLELGKNPAEISRMTGIHPSVISSIKRGVLWKNISINYNIPKPVNTTRDPALKEAITELIFAGYTNREIVQSVGLPDTEFEREYVGLFRRRMLKKQ